LVSDIPAGDGNIEKLFLRCKMYVVDTIMRALIIIPHSCVCPFNLFPSALFLYLSLYLVRADSRGVDNDVPDSDVPDGGHLLLGEDPVPAVLEPEPVPVANPFELVPDNVPRKMINFKVEIPDKNVVISTVLR
jgi:hypothetical protein